jgi:hypothetical protein
MALVEQLNAQKDEKEEKKPGRPKGGTADVARELPGAGTEEAKRQRMRLICPVSSDHG